MTRRPVLLCRHAVLLGAGLAACAPPAADLLTTRPERPPQRIVAASIFATEVLLEIAPRERLAAVHALAGDPRFSLIADRVAGLPTVGAEPEQLLAARPDLVIVDPFTRPETVALLQWAGVPLLRTAAPAGFADIADNIQRVGRACHLESAAAALVERMQERLRELAAKSALASGFRLISLDGDLHTYGRGSLLDAVLTAAGARNLAAEQGAGPFRKLSVETLLAWQPDGLLLADYTAARDLGAQRPAWLDQIPGLGFLDCAGRQRFLNLPGALLGTTSHRLVDTAAAIQAELTKWSRS